MKQDEYYSSDRETTTTSEFSRQDRETIDPMWDNDRNVRETIDADEIGKEYESVKKTPGRDDRQRENARQQLQSSGGEGGGSGGSGGSVTGAEGGAGAGAGAGAAAGGAGAAAAAGGVAVAVAVVAASGLGISGFASMGLPNSGPISAYVEYVDIGENSADIDVVVTNPNGDTIYVTVDGDFCNDTYELSESGSISVDDLKSASEYNVNVGLRDENGSWQSLVEDSSFTTEMSSESKFTPKNGIQFSFDPSTGQLVFNIKNCISDDTGLFSDFRYSLGDGTSATGPVSFSGTPYDTQTVILNEPGGAMPACLTVYFVATNENGPREVSFDFDLSLPAGQP